MNRPYHMQTLKMQGLKTLAVGTKEIASRLDIMRDLMDTKRTKRKKKRRQRRFWTRPGRTSSWWQSFRNNLVVEEEWRENFRLSKTTFNKLCNELRPFLQKKRTSMRAPLDVKTRVAITLYYLCDEGGIVKWQTHLGLGKVLFLLL